MSQHHDHAPHVLQSAHTKDAYLSQVDPRARILAAVALSVVVAAAHRFATLDLALAAARRR